MNVRFAVKSLDGLKKKLLVAMSALKYTLPRVERYIHMSALLVERRLKMVEDTMIKDTTAHKNAKEPMSMYQKSLMPNHVNSVESYLRLSEKAQFTAGMSVLGCGVIKIEKIGTEKVYNLEVEDTHTYILGNGVVAHNCDTLSQISAIDVTPGSGGTGDLEKEYKHDASGIWGDVEDDEKEYGGSNIVF